MDLQKLKTIGIAIWWSEGTKSRRDKRWKNARSYPVEVTNTNPQIIHTFLLFLRKVVKTPEEKLSVQIQIHEGDNKQQLERYWSIVTGISPKRFNKTIVRPVGNKVGKSLGTCKVRFADKETYIMLEEMLVKELRTCGVDGHGIIIGGTRGANLLK